jgi:hypothetical protein
MAQESKLPCTRRLPPLAAQDRSPSATATRESRNASGTRSASTPDTGCWPWLGARWGHKKGYGAAWYENFTWRAHRLFFTLLVRPVADDEHVHHDCRNGLCCNPAHISALHESEHWGHGHADKTHCPHGHEYTEANTIVRWRRTAKGTLSPNRSCRTCRKYSNKDY